MSERQKTRTSHRQGKDSASPAETSSDLRKGTKSVKLPTVKLGEREWQKQVVDVAQIFHWRVAHFRPAQTSKGWRTPVGADGKGYPDLTLIRDRVIWIECKTESGKVSDHQKVWLAALNDAGVEAYVVRPRHFDDITVVLRAKGPVSGWSAEARMGRGALLLELDKHIERRAA